MYAAARPRATAGIALAGAAVLAVSPIAPPLPAVHLPAINVPGIHRAQVELTALANPLEAWANVIAGALANGSALGQELAADGAPLIQKLIANQLANFSVLEAAAQTTVGELTDAINALPATLQTAGGQLASGDITGAASTIVNSLLPVGLAFVDGFIKGVPVAVNVAQNITNVIAATPNMLLPALLAVAAPVVSVVNAGAATAETLVGAIGSGDILGAAGAVLDAPATLTGAILNGFGDGPVGLPVGGLLSPAGIFAPFTAGTISGLASLRDIIAAALHTLSPPAAATTLALKTGSGADVAALPAGKSTESVTVNVPKGSSSTGTESGKPSSTEGSQSGSATGESGSQGDAGASTGTAADGTGSPTGKTDDTTGKTDDTTGKTDTSKGGDDASAPGKSGETGAETGASDSAPAKSHEQSTGSDQSKGSDANGSASDSSSKSTGGKHRADGSGGTAAHRAAHKAHSK